MEQHERGTATRRMMRPVIGVLTAIVILLAIVMIGLLVMNMLASRTTSFPTEQTQVSTVGTLLNRDTGEETAYSLEILNYDDLDSAFIKGWVDSKKDQGSSNGQSVYYTLYNDANDEPMEMYLYMPSAKEVMGDLTLSDIRVSESGKALVLNIDTDSGIDHTLDGTNQILHVYVTGEPGKANAKTEKLIINGTSYKCPNATFTKLD